MPETAADNFHPPTAEQTREHLANHPATSPNPWFGRLPLIALGAIAILLFAGDTVLAATLPWLILLGLFVTLHLRARHIQRREQRVTDCQELAMRRYYGEALARGWTLLPRVTRQPQLRHRTVAVMAHCLDDLASYEAAAETYEHLLGELPEDHPGVMQLEVSRAIAALGCDRLADADDSLRRVQQTIDTDEATALSAAYHLARLFQSVRTHHYEEPTQPGEAALATLRPLGVEAGFGHALLAWCHRQRQPSTQTASTDASEREQPAEPQQPQADATSPDSATPSPEATRIDHGRWMRWWWRNATLLLSPAAIVYRFPELAPLARENPDGTCE